MNCRKVRVAYISCMKWLYLRYAAFLYTDNLVMDHIFCPHPGAFSAFAGRASNMLCSNNNHLCIEEMYHTIDPIIFFLL